MLELAILGLLKERPMHGYELRQQLSQKLGLFWTVSFGSLYPTLKKLERRGVVQKRGGPELASRRKQVYVITQSGDDEFFELLAENASSASEEEKFPLRLAFFRYLRPETRIRLLERRRRYLEDKLDIGRTAMTRARRGRADSYTVALVAHAISTAERDIAWLDELIGTERRLLSGEVVGEPAEPDLDRDYGQREPAAPDPPEEPPTAAPPPSPELQSQ